MKAERPLDCSIVFPPVSQRVNTLPILSVGGPHFPPSGPTMEPNCGGDGPVQMTPFSSGFTAAIALRGPC
jgi:hypothetical protein